MQLPAGVRRLPALGLVGGALTLGVGTAAAIVPEPADHGRAHHRRSTPAARRRGLDHHTGRHRHRAPLRGVRAVTTVAKSATRRGTKTTTTKTTTTAPTTPTTTTATTPTPTMPAPTTGDEILFQNVYPSSGDADNVASTGWTAAQYPSDEGVPQPTRIEFGPAPGLPDDPNLPTTNVARFQLNPYSTTPGAKDGDVTNTGGDLTNRVEVYGRAAGWLPAAEWPDPVGSIRWYSFSVYIPADFPTSTSSKQWFLFTQWKGWSSGTPPVDMQIEGDHFYLGGKHADDDLGAVDPGTWTHFVVGLNFSGSTATGWATVYVDGSLVVDQKPTQTMNTYWSNGVDTVDPDYLKMGIYRSTTWHVTQVIYLTPLTIGTTLASVSP